MKLQYLLVLVVVGVALDLRRANVDAEEKKVHHISKRATPVVIGPSEIQQILNHHNWLRRSQGASDMLELKWNANIAAVAEKYCELCTFNHLSLDPTGTGYSELGQNLYTNPAGVDLTYVMNMWGGESAYYNIADNSCAPGQMCGHYRAMVWAKTREIGCSYVNCNSITGAGPGAFGGIVACQYGPIGNYPNEKPYVPGPACTGCPPGTQCKNGLCTDDCTPESPCDCENTCEHGTLDPQSCSCTCHDGYMGDRCSDLCRDIEVANCYTYWPVFFCTYGEITAHTHKDCTHMCSLCVSKCDVVASNCVHGNKVVLSDKFTDCKCQCNAGWSGTNCDVAV